MVVGCGYATNVGMNDSAGYNTLMQPVGIISPMNKLLVKNHKIPYFALLPAR